MGSRGSHLPKDKFVFRIGLTAFHEGDSIKANLLFSVVNCLLYFHRIPVSEFCGRNR